jgi:hypothetical protein
MDKLAMGNSSVQISIEGVFVGFVREGLRYEGGR